MPHYNTVSRCRGIKYVQGMNELLAPLYYVLKTDPDEDTSSHAEPDSFL